MPHIPASSLKLSSKRRTRATKNDEHRGPEGLRGRDDALVVLSSWLDHQHAIPGDWRTELESINSLSLTDLSRRPELHHRSRDIVQSLHHLSSVFNKLSNAIMAELKDIEVSHKKGGLASLTTDTLVKILEYAVVDTGSKSTGAINLKDAVTLSHVCQHFRNLMLSRPQFWTTMKQSVKMVETCLLRSKDLPLTVEVVIYYNTKSLEWSFDPVLQKLLPHAGRWQNFTINFKYVNGQEAHLPPLQDYERSKDQMIHRLYAPRLERLEINGVSDSYGTGDAIGERWDFSQWITPSLRRLDSNYLFPNPHPSFAVITSVAITVVSNDDLLYSIFEQMTKMHHLRDLSVHFENSDDDDASSAFEALRDEDRLEFPSLRQLNITTQLRFMDEHDPAVKRSLFNLLFFPNVECLRLRMEGNTPIEFDDEDEYDSDYREYHAGRAFARSDILVQDMSFNEEVGCIFRHKDQFPRVVHFELIVNSPVGDYCDNRNGTSEVSIPFNMLPSLKHFTLRSNTRFDIKEPDSDEHFSKEEDEIERVVGDALPVLEAVTLDMFRTDVVASWLANYLRRFKERGDPNQFRQFVLKVGRGDSRGLYGEEALSWCLTPAWDRRC